MCFEGHRRYGFFENTTAGSAEEEATLLFKFFDPAVQIVLTHFEMLCEAGEAHEFGCRSVNGFFMEPYLIFGERSLTFDTAVVICHCRSFFSLFIDFLSYGNMILHIAISVNSLAVGLDKIIFHMISLIQIIPKEF